MLDVADVSLSFEKDVLSSISTPQLPTHQLAPTTISPLGEVDIGAFAYVFLKNLPKLTNENDLIRFFERNHNATLGESSPSANWNCSVAQVKFVRSEDGARLINLAKRKSLLFRKKVIIATIDQRIPSSNGVARSARAVLNPYTNHMSTEESVGASDITSFCVCLHNEQTSVSNSCSTDKTTSYEKCWITNSLFISVFRATLPQSHGRIGMKRWCRIVFENAISDGYITVARRKCGGNQEYVGVAWHKNRGLHADLSSEMYLRLTRKGRLLVHKSFQSRHGDKTVYVCLKNLPRLTHVIDLVQYLEVCLQTTVKRARIEHAAPKFDSCNAHVEFINAKDGARIINKDNVLEYSSTRIYSYIDKNIPQEGLMVNNDPMCFYEKNDSATTEAADKKVRSNDTSSHTVTFVENVTSDEMNKISPDPDCIEEDIGQIHISRATNDLYSDIKHPVSKFKTSNMPQFDKNIPQKGLMVKNDPILFYEKKDNSALAEAGQKVRAGQTSLHTVTFEKNITSDKMNTISTSSDCIIEDNGQTDIARDDNDVYSDVTSNMLQLRKRLEATVAAKDFQQALLVQNDIEKLEKLYHSCSNISAMESNLLLLEKELSTCISEANFTKAEFRIVLKAWKKAILHIRYKFKQRSHS